MSNSNEPIQTLPRYDASPSHQGRLVKDKKLSLHPLSLVAFFVWAVFTAVLIFVLEYAVSHPNLSLSSNPMVWLEAPGLLITVFAQGHVFITVWHLGRLGMPSFNSENRQLGPKTWLEMFWFSSKEWKNPLWLGTFWSARKRHGAKIRISVTFVMFVFVFVVALPTPILLKRAYTVSPINLDDADYPYNTSILSLFPNSSNALDPFTQLNIGQTGWASGLGVEDTYPFRVYAPPGVDLFSSAYNTSVLDDIMFSADMDPGAYSRLPGIRVQSACVIQEIDNFNPTIGVGGRVPQAFLDLCDREELNLQTSFHWGPGMNMTFDMGYCHNLPAQTLNMEVQGQVYWNSSTGAYHDELALIWLNLSDYTPTPATQGIVRCNMSITDSIARLWLDLESGSIQFSDPSHTELFKQNISRPEVPYWPPLLTALNSLSLPVSTTTTNGDNVEIAESEPFISRGRMFGFTLTGSWDDLEGIQLYRKPSLEDASTALRSGALHMAAAINMGASTLQKQVLTLRIHVSWWTRDPPYRLCVFVLLGVWFVMMLALTIFLYRPAIASSMDSYAIAQICAAHPELFETSDEGHAQAHHNPRMLKSFDANSHSSAEESPEK